MRVSDYELLYDLPAGEYDGRGIDGVRTVTIRAGRSLEIMCHPIVKLRPEARREASTRRTSAAMERINARNRERHHMRLIEENFTARAVVCTLTYAYPVEDYAMCDLKELEAEYERRRLPWEMEEARRDARNFIGRLRRRVNREDGRLKWDITIEEGKQPPAPGLPAKFHIHAVIEGPGVTRDVIEACWGRGFTRCEPLELNNDGAARLARYLNKGAKGSRWWSHSRNLRVPQPTVSDRKISRRRLARLAADMKAHAREAFENTVLKRGAKYEDYNFVESIVSYSDYVSGAYIYARFRYDPEKAKKNREEREKEKKQLSGE